MTFEFLEKSVAMLRDIADDNILDSPACEWFAENILAPLVKHELGLKDPVPEPQRTPEFDVLGTQLYNVQLEQIRQFRARREARAQNLVQQPEIADPVTESQIDLDAEMRRAQANIWAERPSQLRPSQRERARQWRVAQGHNPAMAGLAL